MAERRMFAKTIIDSDAFLDMPLSTQALYFHLSMRADDDGFINNPKKIQRMVGASDDDAKLLVMKKFIIPFESGVVVIKHWKIHNYIQKDRYKETVYKEEKSMLEVKDNNAYKLMDTPCIQDVYKLDTQVRIGKDSIEIEQDKEDKKETFVSVVGSYTDNDELKTVLKDFVEMRKKTKGFTVRALKLNLSALDKLASDDITKIAIVNQTVMNGWKSFYPIKNNSNNTKTYNNTRNRQAPIPDWMKNDQPEQPKEESYDDKVGRLISMYVMQKAFEQHELAEKSKAEYFRLTGRDIELDIEKAQLK